MTIYTDRITIVFPIAAKNRKAAASLKTLEITDAGKEFETLVPLDPAQVSQYASQFNLPLLEKVTELEADLATTTSQLEATTQAKTALDLRVATLTNEKQSLTSQVSMLEAVVEAQKQKLIELTPPPKPASVTPAQIRLWLIAHGISLETVSQMISAIPDEATRAAAQVRWEYGLVVLREDPLVQQMGAALGLTVDQMDAAFIVASQIV